MALNIASLNVRGLGDPNKRRELFWLLWKKPYNIIFLQETHSSKELEKVWENEWGGQVYYAHGETNARGVAILVKNLDLKVNNLHRQNGRYLILECVYNQCSYTLANIYGPNVNDPSFFHDIFDIVGQTHGDLILGGDFNVVQDPILDRKENNNSVTDGKTNTRTVLKHYIEEFNLLDIWRISHPDIKRYTWRNSVNKQSRLDYFLISINLQAMVKICEIEPGYKSDHSLISLSIDHTEVQRGPGFWKFNCSILHDIDYTNLVKRVINECKEIYGNGNLDHLQYWEALKLHIRGETIRYCSIKKKKNEAERLRLEKQIKQLEVLETPTVDERKDLEEARAALNKIVEQKTAGAVLRSKVRYYEEGETNTRYFLGLEKRKQSAKQITTLTDEHGNDSEDQNNIRTRCKSFYEDLYKTENCFQECEEEILSTFFNNNANNTLTPQEQDICEGELTKEEILAVLKSSKNGSSPGIDGFPVEFYKFFWGNLSSYLCPALNYAFNTGLLSINHRRGVISLIPKGDKNQKLLKNWRPITLLCCDYKIASKAITHRIKQVLGRLIHHNQTGFLSDRYIGENILTTLEIIEQLENENIPGTIFSVDFEKAFDKIDWEYIDRVLCYYNFGPQLRKWVKLFYTEISSTVNVNGWFTEFFPVTRGVRQGDPLSAYLFLLCVEPLAQFIRENDNITGIQRNAIEHKLNQFADDTLIFTNGTELSMNSVLTTLKQFAKCSGLKINYEKSIAYKIGSLINQNIVYNLNENIQWSAEPIETLGVIIPITQREKIFEYNYKPKIKKVEAVFKQWSKRKLSIQGKVCIIKTLAISQLVYLCSVLPTPPKRYEYDKHIERLIFNFLWNGKPDRIKRRILYNTKENGGLSIPNFKMINIAAKITWVKRYLAAEDDKIWKVLVDISLQKYGGAFFLYCNISPHDKIFDTIKSTVVRDWAMCWSTYNFINSPEENEISMQIIWHNSLFNNKRIVHLKQLICNNIFYIGQFRKERERRLLQYNEFKEKYNIDITFLDYHSLISRIPRRWLDVMEQHDQTNVPGSLWSSKIEDLQSRTNIYGFVYSVLMNELCETPEKSQTWWANELQISRDDINWRSVYKDIYQISNHSKLREFHFKWLHNIVVVNNKLFKWNMVDSSLCDFCNSAPDSITHRFWLCTKTHELWAKLWQYVNSELHIEWNMSYITIVLNTWEDCCQLMKCIILCTKFFIFRCFIAKVQPNFDSLLAYIKGIEILERKVALKNSKWAVHLRKWQNWLNVHQAHEEANV